MRTTFFAHLQAAAIRNPDIVLVTGDLGFGVLEPLIAACPGQVLNVGVAEQNMTGVAAGIALAGAKVFTYSIGNFPTLRCLEQIRNDVAYHGADVTVIAVGGGFAYGALGMSHHATEDLAVMRAIPGVAVAAPGDPGETEAVFADLLDRGGPAYLRLGKTGEKVVHPAPLQLPRGRSALLRTGDDVAILSTGAILDVAADAADRLAEMGVCATVRSFPWLDPLDVSAIEEVARAHDAIVTIEEHSIVGGLGGAVAEVLAELPGAPPLSRIAVPACFTSDVGDQTYLRSLHGLDPAAVSARILKHLEACRGLACEVR